MSNYEKACYPPMIWHNYIKEKRLDYENMIIRRGLDFKVELSLYYKELEETILEGD